MPRAARHILLQQQWPVLPLNRAWTPLSEAPASLTRYRASFSRVAYQNSRYFGLLLLNHLPPAATDCSDHTSSTGTPTSSGTPLYLGPIHLCLKPLRPLTRCGLIVELRKMAAREKLWSVMLKLNLLQSICFHVCINPIIGLKRVNWWTWLLRSDIFSQQDGQSTRSFNPYLGAYIVIYRKIVKLPVIFLLPFLGSGWVLP